MRQIQVFVTFMIAWLLLVLAGTLMGLNYARADQATLVGLGFGPALDGSTQPHFANVEIEHDWGQFALVANGVSIWTQPVVYVASVIPEVKIITPDGILLRCGIGPALVSRIDDRLSSPFEFNIQCAGGLTEGRVEILLEFNHFSDGAPVFGPGPNLGRDAALLHLGFRLF